MKLFSAKENHINIMLILKEIMQHFLPQLKEESLHKIEVEIFNQLQGIFL